MALRVGRMDFALLFVSYCFACRRSFSGHFAFVVLLAGLSRFLRASGGFLVCA